MVKEPGASFRFAYFSQIEPRPSSVCLLLYFCILFIFISIYIYECIISTTLKTAVNRLNQHPLDDSESTWLKFDFEKTRLGSWRKLLNNNETGSVRLCPSIDGIASACVNLPAPVFYPSLERNFTKECIWLVLVNCFWWRPRAVSTWPTIPQFETTWADCLRRDDYTSVRSLLERCWIPQSIS